MKPPKVSIALNIIGVIAGIMVVAATGRLGWGIFVGLVFGSGLGWFPFLVVYYQIRAAQLTMQYRRNQELYDAWELHYGEIQPYIKYTHPSRRAKREYERAHQQDSVDADTFVAGWRAEEDRTTTDPHGQRFTFEEFLWYTEKRPHFDTYTQKQNAGRVRLVRWPDGTFTVRFEREENVRVVRPGLEVLIQMEAQAARMILGKPSWFPEHERGAHARLLQAGWQQLSDGTFTHPNDSRLPYSY